MAVTHNCKDEPVLAEWRGNEEVGQLILTDEISKYPVEVQTGNLLCLAGYAIGMVLAVVPQLEREEVSRQLVKDAFEFAEWLQSTDLAAEGDVQ